MLYVFGFFRFLIEVQDGDLKSLVVKVWLLPERHSPNLICSKKY